jgi:uncharacterized RDD family membrane protein YckC
MVRFPTVSDASDNDRLGRLDFASPWLRLGSYLLEGVLISVTLGIGWCVWALTTGGNGQTPAKKILNLTAIDSVTLNPLGLGKMFWARGFLGSFAGIAIAFTFGVLAFMPFWNPYNQNLMDKFSSSFVVRNYTP